MFKKIIALGFILFSSNFAHADTYTIKAAKNSKDTVFTTVEYSISGKKVDVDIPHFQPETIDEVIQGILNRYQQEKKSLGAGDKNDELLPDIESEIGKTVEIQ